ncbi:hypothetical protein K466DRAFT_646040 [Polyporus arcularius HHB13444]|uniref:C3H1-type domain-containing protein n=1 Tax=Polyporus arcularius HHB13444 TaxID=1314778 RepID=A0A5C3PCT6_9APHY|nr:hypothetical protein K466DRAFT_646040 [Polyporus arcularius HHB13444]
MGRWQRRMETSIIPQTPGRVAPDVDGIGLLPAQSLRVLSSAFAAAAPSLARPRSRAFPPSRTLKCPPQTSSAKTTTPPPTPPGTAATERGNATRTKVPSRSPPPRVRLRSQPSPPSLIVFASPPPAAKDLSHVPCKFFRVGSCTAGSSCPFAHTVLEPGQQKEVCAWFVKGNCKFGHKCALAHVLPGQSMSMDRKNKKAAQLAANAGGGGSQRDGPKSRGHKGQHGPPAAGQSRNPLLSGSTAPTRSLGANARSPIPMPLKATLSPSAPAPPVKDTDFASFGLPDESNKLPSAPAQGKPPASADSTAADADQPSADSDPSKEDSPAQPDRDSPSPLPTHNASAPRRISDASPAVDFGPIGSPPRASSSSSRPARVNGFSPGTSPQNLPISSSPFSAPGTQTVFTVSRPDESLSEYSRAGLSASLGNWSSDVIHVRRIGHGFEEVVVEDDDLEEFIPGSLTDLLTPEERSRRMSRTTAHMVGMERESSQQRSGTEANHRYSRSVPAPSLLQDIKSIWGADAAAPMGSPDATGLGAGPLGGGLGNGTPSSFTSNSGLHARTVEDMLSPSNASAAFLPGLHHYINTQSQRPPMAGGLSSMYGGAPGHNLSTSAYGHDFNGTAMSPPRATYGAHLPLRPAGRGIPGADMYGPGLDDHRSALSPSSRALQAHAPGQSLPQGLAAGYSRIHALPPPPVIASPSSSSMLSRTPLGGGFSPGTKGLGHGHTTSGDWASMSPTAGSLLDQINNGPPPTTPGMGAPGTSLGGLETMFSRLSYSAATSRPAAAPGMGSRNPSGRGPHPQGSLSPLSGPVLTGEDDDLFSME